MNTSFLQNKEKGKGTGIGFFGDRRPTVRIFQLFPHPVSNNINHVRTFFSDRAMIELSSLVASSTIKRFGARFLPSTAGARL